MQYVKRITGGLRHIIVVALSLGLFLVGCGYSPAVRQFSGVSRAVTDSEAFQAAEAALAEQGITLTEVISASGSAAVLATSQSNLVVQVLHDADDVWSVVSIEVTGETFRLVNYYSDLIVEGILAELLALSALGDASHEELQSLSSKVMINDLSRALGVPQNDHELSVLCAACSAAQEAMDDAARDVENIAMQMAAAAAGVAVVCAGSGVVSAACAAAVLGYAALADSADIASTRYVRARDRYTECVAQSCSASGGGSVPGGGEGGGGGGSGGGRP
jgi:hypothetical protein